MTSFWLATMLIVDQLAWGGAITASLAGEVAANLNEALRKLVAMMP